MGRAHGLDGSFYVAEARSPLLTEAGGTVYLDGEPHTVVRHAGTAARPILRLEGVGDRTGADALRGRALQVPRDAAPPLEEDEYWAEDLTACVVRDESRGVEVGVVRRLLAYPSCELLEVAREGGDDLLVPLVRDAVRSVDLEARAIDVDLAFLGEA